MNATVSPERYAKTIANSKKIRWDIDRDVIRGRTTDHSKDFSPDGLSLCNELDFLLPADRRLLSQIQGRTYAFMFRVFERYVAAMATGLSVEHQLGDQVAFEAMVRLADEEIKHQELFRRLEVMMAAGMPAGYRTSCDPGDIAAKVLAKGSWAVLALTLLVELVSQVHYRASIAPRDDVCPLWKDVFLFHWKEESQHAVLDELEFLRADASLSTAQRDAGVTELLELLGVLHEIVQGQATVDAQYFIAAAKGSYTPGQRELIAQGVLKAYLWQYIVSGATEPKFQKILFGVLNERQTAHIAAALEPFLFATPKRSEAGAAQTRAAA